LQNRANAANPPQTDPTFGFALAIAPGKREMTRMQRLSLSLVFAAVLAASPAAIAQSMTTTTSTTVGSVPVTGATNPAPSKGPAPTATDSNPALLNQLQTAQPVLPTVNPPSSSDSSKH
jgi:hypothetical protein